MRKGLTFNEIVYILVLKQIILFFQVSIFPHNVFKIAELINSLPPCLTKTVNDSGVKVKLSVQFEENEVLKFDKKPFLIPC